MLYLDDYKKQPGDMGNEYQIKVFADDKSDVPEGAKIDQLTIDHLPSDCIIQPGSRIYTANGEFAFVKADGTINWI